MAKITENWLLFSSCSSKPTNLSSTSAPGPLPHKLPEMAHHRPDMMTTLGFVGYRINPIHTLGNVCGILLNQGINITKNYNHIRKIYRKKMYGISKIKNITKICIYNFVLNHVTKIRLYLPFTDRSNNKRNIIWC